jgi:hypothetical protein
VHAVVTKIGAHSTIRIGEHHAVVHECEAAGKRQATQPFIQLANLRAWIEVASPEQLPRRRYRGNDNGDAVGTGKIDHRQDVVLVILQRRRTGIAGDVVRADHDLDDPRSQRNDVLPEPCEHLGRRLAANAAADDIVREQRRITAYPVVCDRVAHEHGARARSTRERCVRRLVATHIRPVDGLLCAVAFRVACEHSGLEFGERGPEGLRRCGGSHEQILDRLQSRLCCRIRRRAR